MVKKKPIFPNVACHGHCFPMFRPQLNHHGDHGDHGDHGEVPSHELFSSCQLLLDGLPFPRPNDGHEAVVLGALLAAEGSLGEMALERLATGWERGALGMIFLKCMMYIYVHVYIYIYIYVNISMILYNYSHMILYMCVMILYIYI